MFHPSPAQSGQPNNLETVKGIDTRLAAAVARYQDVQASYATGGATREQFLAAYDELRRLRATPQTLVGGAS